MAKAKKDLDSELNLIAFISLLSVLICSLLLTAIWVQIGTMNVKQAVGGQSAENAKKQMSLWASLSEEGNIVVRLKDAPRKARRLTRQSFAGLEGKVNVDAVTEYLEKLRKVAPDARMALIQPKSNAVYEEIIGLMDVFKKQGFVDLGVAPL